MILLFAFVIGAMFFAMFISLLIARSVTEPLSVIEKKVRDLNAGDFGRELPKAEISELANLTESMNSMASRLKNQFNDLSLEKEKFNSLLQNLKEGVFAVDSQLKILFQNKNTPHDLISPNSQFLSIHEAVTNEAFRSFLLDNISKNSENRTDFEINNKYYGVRIYPLKSNDSVLYIGVIRDKTQEKQSQVIREEFVQNASHELKTPITSIKGYAETLNYKLKLNPGDPEKKFLEAILRNVDRMIRIVEDMLTISRIESYTSLYQPEHFFLHNLTDNFKPTIVGFIKPKKQNLIINIPENLKVQADMVLIEHLLLNLLSNASNYSPEESNIYFSVDENEKFINFVIKDEGIGISPEDIDRIFERFYRVDKNRSRKEGGTGLGLSIVKHIVKLHNGKISVTQNLPRGTIFTVSLPKVFKQEGVPAPEGSLVR